MEWLVYFGGFVAGLVPAVTFIWGWQAKKRVELTGKPFGRVKSYDPVQNESQEARIEQSHKAVEAWEKG